ncbi:MAG: hypothetical protein QGG83_04470, partial [Candidatus Woesearchaeota archaeon]|nr:hypothetical protein [Candidatus Woesearchaeota archaeon]
TLRALPTFGSRPSEVSALEEDVQIIHDSLPPQDSPEHEATMQAVATRTANLGKSYHKDRTNLFVGIMMGICALMYWITPETWRNDNKKSEEEPITADPVAE